jgi:hypothetical protein
MVSFELENDEAVALMQCASAGASAAQVLLGSNARPMAPIFSKIQAQFNDQHAVPPLGAQNGAGAETSKMT